MNCKVFFTLLLLLPLRLWGASQGDSFVSAPVFQPFMQPYPTAVGARPVQARFRAEATGTKKELYYSLSTDKCAYAPGEQIAFTLSAAPVEGLRVRYRHLADVVADTLLTAKSWTWTAPAPDFRGYMVEVYTTDGTADCIHGIIAVDVSSDWVRFPRYGFVATFGNDKTISVVKKEMTWLNRCHINAVQFQDWHNCHDWPLGGTREKPLSSYKDIANRTIYVSAVRNYILRQHQFGMKSFFYNLCFGVLDGYESRGVKEEWLAFKDQNHTQKDKHDLPDSWKSDIYLANPGNTEWQTFLGDRNDDVYACFDFDGYQIDQLGNRGTLYDYYGNKLNLPSGYASFIQAMKKRHPEKRLVMNAVSEYGAAEMGHTGKLDCFYNEVWGCHSRDALTRAEAQFTNLNNIIQNNRSYNPALQTVFAAYMNYCLENGDFNTPGVVMTDAVMFALGGAHLELGGDHMLCREYFPHVGLKMTDELKDWMTRYYDFFTAYENLLRGEWSENSKVKVTARGVTVNKWEPVNKQITQVARDVEGRKVIHLLNFCTPADSKVSDPAYLLCWHDRDGLRPWPTEHNELSLTISGLSGLGKNPRVWVASPDYLGGAVQEITEFSSTSTSVRFTLPALQFWSMIVVEPESVVTAISDAYAPSLSALEQPLVQRRFTLAGIPAFSQTRGIVVQEGRKVMKR